MHLVPTPQVTPASCFHMATRRYHNHPMPPTHSLLLIATAVLLIAATTSASYAAGKGAGVYTPPSNSTPRCWPEPPVLPIPIHPGDIDRLQFAENIEYCEAEFFLHGAFGKGLDWIAPGLAHGGPPPIDGRKANLDIETQKIIEEFAYQEVGHLRALQTTVGWFPRPLLDLSPKPFARVVNMAFGYEVNPPFDPYANSLNYWLACYMIPYMGINGYVGASPNINGYITKRLLAGLLGVEAGQDAVIRKHLYDRAFETVYPYKFTVAEFTDKVSMLRNKLQMCGIKDEGICVPPWLGAENRTESNVLSADANSLSYPRLPGEILRFLYLTGDEHCPGGFYPKGGNGRIARQFLKEYYQGQGPPYDGGAPYEGGGPYDGGAPYEGTPYASGDGTPYQAAAAYGGNASYDGTALEGVGAPSP